MRTLKVDLTGKGHRSSLSLFPVVVILNNFFKVFWIFYYTNLLNWLTKDRQLDLVYWGSQDPTFDPK